MVSNMDNNAVSNNSGSTSVNSSAIIARFGIPSTKSTGSAPTLNDAATTTAIMIPNMRLFLGFVRIQLQNFLLC